MLPMDNITFGNYINPDIVDIIQKAHTGDLNSIAALPNVPDTINLPSNLLLLDVPNIIDYRI